MQVDCYSGKMIFVTVGIGGSDGIVRKVDDIASKSKEKFFVVLGEKRYVNYIPKYCKWVYSVPSIIPYVRKARLVIAHGGAGTIFECLKNGSRIITIAKKHTDNHQTDIVNELSERGYIIRCESLDALEKCIKSKQRLKKYISPKAEIADKILEFIEAIN